MYWQRYFHDNTNAPPNYRKLPPNIEPIHLLWTLSFLRLYLVDDAAAGIWKTNRENYECMIWSILDTQKTSLHPDELNMDDRFDYKRTDFGEFGSRLATECEISAPCNYETQKSFFSGYKGYHTVKYITITLIFLSLLQRIGRSEVLKAMVLSH